MPYALTSYVKKLAVALTAALLIGAAGRCGFAAPASGDTWKFVVLGDSRGSDNGVNSETLNILVKAVIAEKPRLVIFTGDLVTGSFVSGSTLGKELKWWRTLFVEPMRKEGIAVYPIRGNHEILETSISRSDKEWREVFSGDFSLPGNGPAGEEDLTYSFTYRNAFFAGFDLYEKASGRRMDLGWFEKQAGQNKQPFVFAYAHEPLYTREGGEAHGSGAIASETERNRFVEAFARAGGVCYFCGHDHWYDHSKTEAVPGVWFHQFVVGTAGAPLRVNEGKYAVGNVTGVAHGAKYGYLVAEINGDTATLTMKEYSDGRFTAADTFSFKAKER